MRRMHYYIAVPVFLIALLIQTTILWRIPLFGFSPNILLCLVCVFSFLYDEKYGLILGAVFGAMLDIATSMYFGPQTLSFIICYVIVRLFRLLFNHEKVLSDMLMGAICTPAACVTVWTMNTIMHVRMDFIFVLKSLPVLIIMHVIIVGLFHLIFVRSIIKYPSDRKYEGGLM